MASSEEEEDEEGVSRFLIIYIYIYTDSRPAGGNIVRGFGSSYLQLVTVINCLIACKYQNAWRTFSNGSGSSKHVGSIAKQRLSKGSASLFVSNMTYYT